MNESMDNTMEEAMLQALQNAKEYSRKRQINKEKQFWKKVSPPFSLHQAIHSLTKSEMDIIRKNYGFKNLSSLKKKELASELTKLIPLHFEQVIRTLDQGRYDLIKAIISNSGVIHDVDIAISHLEAMMGCSIIFPGLDDKHKHRILYMPDELIHQFLTIDGDALKAIVWRNTEWIQLTHGMLYYYGVLDSLKIMDKIRELTGQQVDFMDFADVMHFACNYYGQVKLTPYGYQNDYIFDAKSIMEEQDKRPNVAYYPFTRSQLLKASAPDYVDRTPELNNFISFIKKNYEFNEQESNEIGLQITYMINVDAKPALILEYLQSMVEFPSMEFVNKVFAKIMNVYNHTRQWALKGYTPDELFQKERMNLRPLQPNPFTMGRNDSSIEVSDRRSKIGRNELCPCGSGKKYKRCCGK